MTYIVDTGCLNVQKEWASDAALGGGVWDFLTDGLTTPSGWTMNYSFSGQTPTTCELTSAGKLDIVIPSTGSDRVWFEFAKNYYGCKSLSSLNSVSWSLNSDFSAMAAFTVPNNTTFDVIVGEPGLALGTYCVGQFQKTSNEWWFRAGRSTFNTGLAALDWFINFDHKAHFSPEGMMLYDNRGGTSFIPKIDYVDHGTITDKGWLLETSHGVVVRLKYDTVGASTDGLDALITGPIVNLS